MAGLLRLPRGDTGCATEASRGGETCGGAGVRIALPVPTVGGGRAEALVEARLGMRALRLRPSALLPLLDPGRCGE